ncbi:MAG: class I SAM-dependent methyltransferase, partial [Chloroflexi bacterium]|nr:class I SAM-dependent methyltransferase [Chloroflexota bacterium]
LFDYCKVNFSKNVALLHDYKLYDFTIIVRK